MRGFSQFGDSYVYVIFEDGTDPYWARSRVLEYLNRVQGKLPAESAPSWDQMPRVLAGSMNMHWWIAAVKHDLADLRSLQDWFLKYELKPSLTLRKWRRWAVW